ncbi:hypothetical protein [uncultured Sphingomonas sp.]|uniref:hypothetical protein n=1 Tax=uncultured Sphingomonas sp. TaxID=158754 RepID=UPI0025D74CD3|nr:hypothetical protein [uncultured Sphingomonas sp.]
MTWGKLAALCGAILAATPAAAEWLEASSRHFVLYSDTSEKMIRRQSEALERLDWGLRRFAKVQDEPEIASRKVTVFLIDDSQVRSLCGCQNVGGFYQTRVSGSIAFSGKASSFGDNGIGQMVLFHEYAHHFMFASYDLAFPAWYTEGFAEFASTMRIKDDSAQIGVPAQHRARGLFQGQRFRVPEMFDPTLRSRLGSAERQDAFYGRGWLLTHYLTFKPERYRQFQQYLRLLNSGTPSVAAAEQSFGDLGALSIEVDRYLAGSRMPAMTMMYDGNVLPAARVRRLSAGEADMIDLRMRSIRGVTKAEAAKLYARAAPIAAKYADDALVQGWLAEMAFDAEHYDAAVAAADQAIARDARSVQAHMYRGAALLRQLKQGNVKDAAQWDRARRSIIAANRSDPDDAEPLWWFWLSFQMQEREPTPSAIKGLYRAQELTPQDWGVRMAAAVGRIESKEWAEAKRLLRPIAYHPHAPEDNLALAMLTAIEAGKTGSEIRAVGEVKTEATTEQP